MDENMNAYLENTAKNTAKKIAESCTVTNFYLNVWCERLGYTQANPWGINNTTELQDMQTAAEMFIKNWDDQNNMVLLNNKWTGDIIIFVQDWRGRIAKFELQEVELNPAYIIRRIQ